MYSLGIDIGSSSIKVALFDIDLGITVSRIGYPEQEMSINAVYPGWAEQDPEAWWNYTQTAIKKVIAQSAIDGKAIDCIGITYQMHGLVLVDKNKTVLRQAIIWCDSRAVAIGAKAFDDLGHDFCLTHLLNSPGNFTASKLRWVKENESQVFEKIHKIMLPGDYIAMKLSDAITITKAGLSEGIFWDYIEQRPSEKLLRYYGLDEALLPAIVPEFGEQGVLSQQAASSLGMRPGIPIAYRAGDQPNNAFSLHVMQPGEIAATAGTSGVVYGVADRLIHDTRSRINPFIHVSNSTDNVRLGMLLCINGTGILNSWMKKNVGGNISYDEMNALAAKVPIGADGLSIIPFGNGSERMLENKSPGGNIFGLQFNRHGRGHVFRAAQEGIAFSFAYGIHIMNELGMQVRTIRAAHANLFLSEIFCKTLSLVTGATIELYNTDGAEGAARGATYGAGIFHSFDETFASLKKLKSISPDETLVLQTQEAFKQWQKHLSTVL